MGDHLSIHCFSHIVYLMCMDLTMFRIFLYVAVFWFFLGDCTLPAGDDVESSSLANAELDTLKMDCKYANPAADKIVVLSAMAKAAATRQHWLKDHHN